jgi:RNA polymerase subunit RPABC4/transcription elongation factor Spt4
MSIKCPFCRAPQEDDAATCTVCGWHIKKKPTAPGEGQPGGQTEKTMAEGLQHCPMCQMFVGADINICPKCGIPLHKSDWMIKASFCPNCRGIMGPTDTVCSSCGWKKHEPAREKHKQKIGVLLHDITVEGVLAFRKDEYVKVEEISSDPDRPEYKYVVLSKTLNKRFRLSDRDLGL